MRKSIEHYIMEEFGISESRISELDIKKSLKILKKFGFLKGKDFEISGSFINVTDEETAQDISDELAGSYEVTYDEDNNFRLTIFG